MASIMRMPKLGLTMEKATILTWFKKEGDKIKKGETIVEIETDKIVNEIESPYNGTLLKILSPQDTEVEIQSPLCIIGSPHENVEEILRELSVKSSPTVVANKKGTGTDNFHFQQMGHKGRKNIIITPRAKKLIKEKGLLPSITQEIGKTRITEKDIINYLQNKNRNDRRITE